MAVPTTRRGVAASLFALAFAGSVTGCGSSKHYQNNPRPPQPIVVSASINTSGITVNPANFGAGQIQLDIVNLTTSSQQLELVSRGRATAFSQQTGPINPQDTAELKASLVPGAYTVRVTGGKVRGTVLTVGAQRPSSQNQLLQP